MLKKYSIVALGLTTVVLAGCSGQKVEMSFEDAHKQFNDQMFATMIKAQDTMYGFDYMEADADFDFTARSTEFDAAASLEMNSKGSQEEMETNVTLEVDAKEDVNNVELEAMFDIVMRIAKGGLYININEAIVDMGEENPAAAMIQATLQQYAGTWINFDLEEIAALTGEPMAYNPFDPSQIRKAQDFVVDMQKLISTNNLFVQKGEMREVDGKVAYDVAFNIEGITKIAEGMLKHDYILQAATVGDQAVTEAETQQILDSIPLLFASLDVQAYIKVNAEDNIELVIDKLGLPDSSNGLVDSMIGPKKTHISVMDEFDTEILTIDGKGHSYTLVFKDAQGDVAELDVDLSASVKENSIAYGVDADLAIYDMPPLTMPGQPLDITFTFDQEVTRTSETTIEVPTDVRKLSDILASFGLTEDALSAPAGVGGVDEFDLGDE